MNEYFRAKRTEQFTLFMACLFFVASQLPSRANGATRDDVFRNKVAVITGSSSGLGAELAKLAASHKMKLVLVDKRISPSIAFAADVNKQGGDAIAVEIDLADPQQRGKAIDTALERYGRIDYLFNNAGYAYIATVEQMDVAEAHRLFEVNYWAYLDLAQRAIPHMKKPGGGTIVNIVSIVGHIAADEGMAHYSATKHALVGAFQVAARELKAANIKVFIASPGGMRTNIGNHAIGPLADERRRRDQVANWEDPAIPARDIFDKMQGHLTIFYPGYIDKERTTLMGQ